ncbi:MAG: hypothetical protein JSU00_09935 [Acidobacteria bacterium]|nr:hypothetical protein [Acidobacteriota bacterium]
MRVRTFLPLAAAMLAAVPLRSADRLTISLDGQWDIADSKIADPPPAGAYTHKAPVPGLAHSATPAFPDVDEFDSREVIQNRVRKGVLPASALVHHAGNAKQDRNYFWYRREFVAPAVRQSATLRINKAQFGAAVWLNDVKIGEHLPCFSAAILDISKAIHPGRNTIVIRIGAHPGVLPTTVTAGTDFEKNRWTPGVYDSVSVALADNPTIETVQAAPRIASSSILVRTRVRNRGSATASFAIDYRVHAWKSTALAATLRSKTVVLKGGEEVDVTDTIPIPNARLWTPEHPNLYVLETRTPGDSVSTRFGMREIRFDTASKRALLNGRVYFLRGSNITLHRFFEDPKSGVLPWDETWVRKLLVEIPKQMHWNAFRFCIGPAPDKWFDIADEAGLLIQNEYFVWTGRNWSGAENQVHFDADQMIREYSEWMRDNWNHPSVALWDATNETYDPMFAARVIPAVRGLDLSNRAWENSYNGPAGPDDPVEDHPYEFQRMADGGPEFSMTTFERPWGKAPGAQTGHAMILNEYGWLWLNRDGSPTQLTRKLYPRLLGEGSTAEDRLALDAYLLGGITEYWRAYREYAGVLHFVYLMSSDPEGYTADHFRDIERLELDPHFRDYLSQAFRPLGVYVSYWQPTTPAGSTPSLAVMMVNDSAERAEGELTITLESADGAVAARKTAGFAVAGLGAETYTVDFPMPSTPGKYLLKASAAPRSKAFDGPTLSRRRIEIVAR